MRIPKVEAGEGWRNRAFFSFIRVVSGFRAPDVVRTLNYRPSFFGAHHTEHSEQVMRGVSPWTVGERELFAAYVSNVNACRF